MTNPIYDRSKGHYMISRDDLEELQRLAKIGEKYDKPTEPEPKIGQVCKFWDDRERAVYGVYDHKDDDGYLYCIDDIHRYKHARPIKTGDLPDVCVWQEHDGSSKCPCPDANAVLVKWHGGDMTFPKRDPLVNIDFIQWNYIEAYMVIE